MIAGSNADHDRIRLLANRLDLFLVEERAPLGADFARQRWELIRELATHFALERASVRARAATCDARTAQRLDVDLENVWRSHVVRWTGASVHADWREYRMATRALLSRIRMRMVWEERLGTEHALSAD